MSLRECDLPQKQAVLLVELQIYHTIHWFTNLEALIALDNQIGLFVFVNSVSSILTASILSWITLIQKYSYMPKLITIH